MRIFQKRDRPLFIIPLVIVAIDSVIKHVVLRLFNFVPFPESVPIPIFGDVLRLTYVQNFGNIFQFIGDAGKETFPYVLGGVMLITLFVLLYFYANVPNLFARRVRQPAKACLMAILGGDISNNLTDRMIRGFSVDYLDFGIGDNRFYTFNFSDLCIISAAVFLTVLILFFEKKDKKETKNL